MEVDGSVLSEKQRWYRVKCRGLFSCRALSENEPEAKFEFSANGTSALNESKPKAQPEFSASGTCRALSEDEPEAKCEVSENGTRTLNENERSEVRI